MADQYLVLLDAAAPSGKYVFEVELYQASTLKRLAVLGPDGRPVDDRVLLGQVKVLGPAILPPTLTHHLGATLGEHIVLVSYDLPQTIIEPGETLSPTLYWQARAEIADDYTVFTHLIDQAGQIWAQQDSRPQGGRYPTSIWAAGEVIWDGYRLAVKPDTPAGRYLLEVGLYDARSGERLPVRDATGQRLPDDRVLLAEIKVGR